MTHGLRPFTTFPLRKVLVTLSRDADEHLQTLSREKWNLQ